MQRREDATEDRDRCVVEHADASGARFHDANLRDAEFENVNMSGARFENVNLGAGAFENVNLGRAVFHDVNMSDVVLSAVQLGGAKFCQIGLPPGVSGNQRPMTFEVVDLNQSTFTRCDLGGVKIRDCNVEGMTIDGVKVTDLLAAYRRVPR